LLGTGLGAFAINNLYFEKPGFLVKSAVKFAIAESVYINVESLITSYYQNRINLTSSNRSKRISKAVKRIFTAAMRESKANLDNNNLVKKFDQNYHEIIKNYIPFFYTNFDLNGTYNVKDSLELILLRDDFDQKINQDKIVIYSFSKTDFLFKDHFKRNYREILEFEKKIMKDSARVKAAVQKLKLNEGSIKKNSQEPNDLVTFKIDK
jgi:hypothetical protein